MTFSDLLETNCANVTKCYICVLQGKVVAIFLKVTVCGGNFVCFAKVKLKFKKILQAAVIKVRHKNKINLTVFQLPTKKVMQTGWKIFQLLYIKSLIVYFLKIFVHVWIENNK